MNARDKTQKKSTELSWPQKWETLARWQNWKIATTMKQSKTNETEARNGKQKLMGNGGKMAKLDNCNYATTRKQSRTNEKAGCVAKRAA
jgi:hypothetical protein